MALYEKFKRDESLTQKEAAFILPSRDYLLAVYNFMKQNRVWKFGIEIMLYRNKCPAEQYCRMAVALDVLAELGLILVKDNIYSFDGDGKKTDLSASDILARLTKAGGATDE